jgi:hypothetical protein
MRFRESPDKCNEPLSKITKVTRADQALYEAKRAGRDRVHRWVDPAEQPAAQNGAVGLADFASLELLN